MKNCLTLREGLECFHLEYSDHLSHNKPDLSEEARNFFASHDVAHVLFGCDISLYGEGSVKIWTLFGTSLGFWKHLSGYKAVNALQLSNAYTFNDISANIFKLLISVPSLILRAKRMSKRWPWSDYDRYLDVPIADIREEFNIRVMQN